jgi:hypothetical protein
MGFLIFVIPENFLRKYRGKACPPKPYHDWSNTEGGPHLLFFKQIFTEHYLECDNLCMGESDPISDSKYFF